jgi:hemerythrin-like domain-containing protein
MNAISLIREQHDGIERALDSLRQARPPMRQAWLEYAATLIEAHAEMEEKVFYPLFRTSRDAAAIHELAKDHQLVRRQLVVMMSPRTPADVCASVLDALIRAVHVHARDEEEARLLPLVARALRPEQLDALGDEMLAFYDELMQHQPYREIEPEALRAAL